jgi:organic hydroperoxide reductase OsmC/OhrA
MSEHPATVRWERTGEDFGYDSFNRDHELDFGHGLKVPASSAPDYLGSADRVDPEQAYVAAVSSCHMLTFLALAAKRRFVVESYEDEAVGTLDKNADGRMAMTRVQLRPRARFGADAAPDADTLAQLHEKAHKYCFISNSITAEVDIEL